MSGNVAVTGASGFIGRRLVQVLRANGYAVRALVRRPPPADAPQDITWVRGDLHDHDALAALVDGAGIVVHLAGAIKAFTADGFNAANVAGTRNVAAAAAKQKSVPHFVHISSLAAREPQLSSYAASKAAAEDVARQMSARLPVTILRPPAVYGPGDPETLRIFRMAAAGFVAVPRNPAARLSLAHVDDAAAAIMATFALTSPSATPLEFDDGFPGGHDWRAIAGAAAQVLGRPVRLLAVPDGVLNAVGWASGLAARLAGRPTVLTREKVNELLHADWVAHPPGVAGYRPAWTLVDGFRNTAQWAASEGLVRIFQAK